MGSKRSIRVHPKYGLNPTVPVCFWCGEDTGEVALMGAAIKGKAPSKAIINYEPCAKCKMNMAMGLVVIECTSYQRDDHQVQMQPGAFPTGRWCVIRRESGFVQDMQEPQRSQILQAGMTFMEPASYEECGFHHPLMDHPATKQ